VTHAYNPNYSGGRDQEDLGLSQPRQIVQETLSQKTTTTTTKKNHHKKGMVEWLKGIGTEFKPQYHKRKKERRKKKKSPMMSYSLPPN
jgi:hypothetical protein